MSKKLVKEDLFNIYSVANPVIAPNNEEALYIKTEMHEEDNTYYSYLYHLDFSTGLSNQWTFGKERISSVKWSPNGKYVSFVSSRNEQSNLYLLSKAGGEAQVASSNIKDIRSYEWTQTSEEIIFTATVELGSTFEGYKKEEDKNKKPEIYKVESMRYKLNGVGLIKAKQRSQLGKINIETKAVTRLIEDTYDYAVQSISSTGETIILNRYLHEDDQDFKSQLISMNLQTMEQEVIVDLDAQIGGASFSPDDAYIAFEVSMNQPYRNAQHNQIYIYDVAQKFYWSLTEMMDLPVGDYATGDIQQNASAPSLVWTNANDLYFQMSSMGDVRLYYATLTGAIYPATPEEEHIYGYDITNDGIYALIAVSTTTSIGDLYLHEITTGKRSRLTTINEQFEEEHLIVKPEIVQVFNEEQLIWGWFMKPATFEEGKKYPLILNIHGGPHMMYANTFVHEMQFLAAEGYAVLYMNPRGSHSYSQDFVNGCRGDYGGGDYRDLMAAVDMIIEENPWIDTEKLGVTGGSYGGFMTNWIVGHTDRFKAALTQRSISNWISFYGVSDIGYYFTPWQIEADMTDVVKLWEHSPLKYVEQMNTPLMILHSELDFRCPIEQAEQLFITMKSMDKDVEFIRFPQANHDLSRSGLPNLRMARLQAIQEWFIKKL
ncbi:MAG: S9 family peptidase [Kurthia sp.]|nr:S9 family peptidase [Candidatus Kurthia equi]